MRALPLLLSLLLLGACDDMANQRREKPYESKAGAGPFRPSPAPGSVAVDEAPVPAPPVTLALLQRGQQRFEIYCAPCHGRTGEGDGRIVERGFPHPPAYSEQRLRAAPAQHFYDVITHGWGVMFPYAARVAPADRWAIAAYIRALQARQDVPVAELTPDERGKLP